VSVAPEFAWVLRELLVASRTLYHFKIPKGTRQPVQRAMMLLRQQLLKYERDNGTEILIPQTVYAALGVSREDWG